MPLAWPDERNCAVSRAFPSPVSMVVRSVGRLLADGNRHRPWNRCPATRVSMLWIAVPELVLHGAQIGALAGQAAVSSRVGVQFGRRPAAYNVAAISAWATGSRAASSARPWGTQIMVPARALLSRTLCLLMAKRWALGPLTICRCEPFSLTWFHRGHRPNKWQRSRGQGPDKCIVFIGGKPMDQARTSTVLLVGGGVRSPVWMPFVPRG